MRPSPARRPLIVLAALAALAVACVPPGSTGAAGLVNGRLAPCPDTRTCVSSEDHDVSHFMPPIPYVGTRQQTDSALRAAILAVDPGATFAASQGDYLAVEIPAQRVVPAADLEFLFDDANQVVRFRAASRGRLGDFGENRRRIRDIEIHMGVPKDRIPG